MYLLAGGSSSCYLGQVGHLRRPGGFRGVSGTSVFGSVHPDDSVSCLEVHVFPARAPILAQ